ncbi:probable inactive receptor kinase At2g26730, partial [Momordica charantia]|uniref:Probable inactive receptor kinase At2g26730 n=1 Tax=Momordica charantia TaxID=3673 RepID=A0A6J1CUK9_MOMCH
MAAVFYFRNCLPIFLISLLLLHRAQSEPSADKEALLDFFNKTPHESRLQWNASTSACTWVGVLCDATQSFVFALRLPGVGLVGPIPPNTIGRLNRLRVLSLRSNRISGGLPPDFANLTFLRSLYLQDNELSGDFPVSVTQLTRLTRLDLSSNNFSGSIPFSVNNLTHLSGLFLENNGFSGSLPSIPALNLTGFNVSNNKLNGSIPETLSKFSAASFAGNLQLCGGPLPSCNPFFPSPAPSPTSSVKPPLIPVEKKSKKLSTAAIIGIVVASAVVAFILLFLLIFCLRKRERRQPAKPPNPVVAARSVPVEAGTSSSKDDITGGSVEAEKNRLVFFDGGVYSFDLEDLLRASAEVLGKGSVGTSYKAVLEEGTTVVVKRLKDVVLAKKEFETQMEALGIVKHENVVPLRAFYYSRDEKLLVSDYMSAGSLSASLHGSRGSGRTPLDWDNRMKIALSAARGLAHLHVSGKLVHGNIKSSNVLLRPNNDAAVSDFGLNPLFGT